MVKEVEKEQIIGHSDQRDWQMMAYKEEGRNLCVKLTSWAHSLIAAIASLNLPGR